MLSYSSRFLGIILVVLLLASCGAGSSGQLGQALFNLQQLGTVNGALGALAGTGANQGYGETRYSGIYVGSEFHPFPEAPKDVGCLQRPQQDYSGCWTVWGTYQMFTKPQPPIYSISNSPPTVIIRHEYVGGKASRTRRNKEKPACVEDGTCKDLEE